MVERIEINSKLSGQLMHFEKSNKELKSNLMNALFSYEHLEGKK